MTEITFQVKLTNDEAAELRNLIDRRRAGRTSEARTQRAER